MVALAIDDSRRWLSVLTIHDRVNKHGLSPETVADRLDLDLADVYRLERR